MSVEFHIEVSKPEEGMSNIQVQKVEGEDFSSLLEAEETYRERFLDAGRDRDTAVGVGVSLTLIGGWMLLDGVAKNDAVEAATGGIVQTAGISISVKGLTGLQEKYEAAKHALNEFRVRLSSIDK